MGETRRNDPSSSEPTDTDLELILAVAKSVARAKGANHHEADEVAQSTVVKLWQKWQHQSVLAARGRPDGQWVAYVRTTARNVYIDRIRGHQRRINRQTRASVIHPGNTVTTPNGWQIPAIPEVAEWAVGRSFIVEQIRALPPKQRVVAEGIFLRELTVSELADELGVQPQLVRKHLRKAKQLLQDWLSEAERQAL
jgi:RNA polymerase sigma factor (sigma-70 family)